SHRPRSRSSPSVRADMSPRCWVVIACFAVACTQSSEKAQKGASGPKTQTLDREPLKPIPEPAQSDARLALLGKRLFEEKRLSSDGTIACASCHDLGHAGVDGKPRSSGVGGHLGGVNAPTVFNSGLNFVQFWDGRAATLEDQVGGPLTHPDEMGATWD